MSTTRLGTLTVGAAVPAISLSISQLTALLAADIARQGELTARLAIALSPPTPPDPATLAQAIAKMLLQYNPLAAAAAMASGKLSVQAALTAITARVSVAQALVGTLSGAVSAGGIAGYTYEGRADALGSEVGSALVDDFGSSTQTKALVLAVTDPAAWAALGSILKTS